MLCFHEALGKVPAGDFPCQGQPRNSCWERREPGVAGFANEKVVVFFLFKRAERAEQIAKKIRPGKVKELGWWMVSFVSMLFSGFL